MDVQSLQLLSLYSLSAPMMCRENDQRKCRSGRNGRLWCCCHILGHFLLGRGGQWRGSVLLYSSEPSAQIGTKGNWTLFLHHSWALNYSRLVIGCNSHIWKALVASYNLSGVACQTVNDLRELHARMQEFVWWKRCHDRRCLFLSLLVDRREMTPGISNDCGQEFDQDRLRGCVSRGHPRHKVPHVLVIGNAIKLPSSHLNSSRYCWTWERPDKCAVSGSTPIEDPKM